MCKLLLLYNIGGELSKYSHSENQHGTSFQYKHRSIILSRHNPPNSTYEEINVSIQKYKRIPMFTVAVLTIAMQRKTHWCPLTVN